MAVTLAMSVCAQINTEEFIAKVINNFDHFDQEE